MSKSGGKSPRHNVNKTVNGTTRHDSLAHHAWPALDCALAIYKSLQVGSGLENEVCSINELGSGLDSTHRYIRPNLHIKV